MIGVKQDILLSLKQQLIKVIQLINKQTNSIYSLCVLHESMVEIKHIKIRSLAFSSFADM